eukprot:362607-Chlamydomonas_euryale.AAC.9
MELQLKVFPNVRLWQLAGSRFESLATRAAGLRPEIGRIHPTLPNMACTCTGIGRCRQDMCICPCQIRRRNYVVSDAQEGRCSWTVSHPASPDDLQSNQLQPAWHVQAAVLGAG